jgi:hypothetical protein
MLAIVTIDTLAQRYGYLPSELLNRASTFDLWICNSAIRYQQQKQAESQGDFSHYDEEELMAIKAGAI